MRCCYDKEKKVFLPYRILKMNIKGAVAEELEKLVKDCLSLSEEVKSKKWFLSKAKENEIQDTVDTVLTITYPYISEGHGWTNSFTEIHEDSETYFVITLNLQYIPYEDKTTVIIGTMRGETSRPVKC